MDATNWREEQAIRPAVVNRKVWGGNRTWSEANVQATVMSELVTCGQQGIDALKFFAAIEAGARVADQVGELIGGHAIANPADGVAEAFLS